VIVRLHNRLCPLVTANLLKIGSEATAEQHGVASLPIENRNDDPRYIQLRGKALEIVAQERWHVSENDENTLDIGSKRMDPTGNRCAHAIGKRRVINRPHPRPLGNARNLDRVPARYGNRFPKPKLTDQAEGMAHQRFALKRMKQFVRPTHTPRLPRRKHNRTKLCKRGHT
jgi:hypothetical protein